MVIPRGARWNESRHVTKALTYLQNIQMKLLLDDRLRAVGASQLIGITLDKQV